MNITLFPTIVKHSSLSVSTVPKCLVRMTGLEYIVVRLGQALAGDAHPRRIQMGSSPCRTKKEAPFRSFQ